MLRIRLDGNILSNEPDGLSSATVKVKRDPVLKFLAVNYISNLTFWGDGYQFIKNIIDTDGTCGTIEAIIEKKCGNNWEVFYNGVIDLSSVEHNLTKCTIKADIEDENLTALVLKRKDIKVSSNVLKTITGATMATPLQARTTEIQDPAVSSWTNRVTYLVSDWFQLILNYISDNQITFVSDFFQNTAAETEKYTLTTAGGSAIYNWDDAFNEAIAVLLISPPAYTIDQLTSKFGFNAPALLSDPFDNLDAFNYAQWWMRSRNNGVGEIYLETPLPYKNFTGSSGLGTTLTKTQDLVVGMFGLMITDGHKLRTNTTDQLMILSFEDLFTIMNNHFNLAFRLTRVSGNVVLRMEQVDYFFNNATTVNIQNVPEIKYKANNQFNYEHIKVGETDNTNISPYVVQQGWASSVNCSEDGISLVTDTISNPETINQQLTSTSDALDDNLFLIEAGISPIAGLYRSRAYELTKWSGSTDTVYFILNSFLTNYHKIRNWFFGSGGNYLNEGREMINDTGLTLSKEYEITYPLNNSQISDILTGISDFIVFSDAKNNNDRGWIVEADISVKDGMTNFKLIA